MDSNRFLESSVFRLDLEPNNPSSFATKGDEPTQQKIHNHIASPYQSLDLTFRVIPDPQEIARANQWTTTLENLLDNGSKMNTSIT
jgi:hypothetical protein